MNSTSTYLIISAIAALLLGILKIMYSSKCSKINCCFGAVDITRDIISEVEEHKYKIDHQQNNSNIPSIQNIVKFLFYDLIYFYSGRSPTRRLHRWG